MKIKEITVGKSYKLSRNYNSVETQISMTALLDENENEEEVFNELAEYVDGLAVIEIENQVKKLGDF